MSLSKIIVFTNKDDAHADALIDRSERATGIECIRLNTEDLIGNVRYFITPERFSLGILDSKRHCSSEEIAGAWWRRPKPAKLPYPAPPGYDDFIGNEVWEVARGLFAMCGSGTCLPSREFGVRPSNKVRQLYLAKQLGLSVPDTHIGNDFDALEGFLQRNPIVVMKTLRWPSLETPEIIFPMYAAVMESASLLNDRERYDNGLPIFVQSVLEKAADVRVVVIADKVFGISMMASLAEAIDIREIDEEKIRFEQIPVPEEVVAALRQIMARDGLLYSAADFIIDTKGKWWFLENNPNGQFYWLERKTGAEMLTELLQVLSQGGNSHLG